MKFKVGDRVKCTFDRSISGLSKGDVRIVVGGYDVFVEVMNRQDKKELFYEDRFVLINNNLPDELFNI